MNWEAVLNAPAVERVGWALVHFLWQGVLIALLAAFFLRAMRRRSAEARYVVALAALCLMAAIPVSTMFLVRVETQADTIRRVVGQFVEMLRTLPNSVDGAIHQSFPAPDSETAVSDRPELVSSSAWRGDFLDRLRQALAWIVLVWMLGVVALSVRQLTAWGMVQRLRRQFVRPIPHPWDDVIIFLAARIGVRRAVTLLESAAVEVPSVIGWVRPVVLLPASALTGLAPKQIEAILAHELAHIRRHDYLANIFQAAVETLLFYHPAVWWLGRRIRQERENCCDDLAVRVVGDARGYALALTRMEELRTEASDYAMALTGGDLMKRIQRLLGIHNEDPAGSRWLAGALAGLTMLVIGCFATGVPRAGAQATDQSVGSLTVVNSPDAMPSPAVPESPAMIGDYLDPAGLTKEQLKKIEDAGYSPDYVTPFDMMVITGQHLSKPASKPSIPVEKMAGFVAFDPSSVVGGDSPAIDINMDRMALQIALAAARESHPEIVKLVEGIDFSLVKFKVYDGLSGDDKGITPALAKQSDELVGKGWSPVFRVLDGGDIVHVLMKTEDNRVKGIVLIVGDSGDLIYGNIVMDADANEFGSRLGVGMNKLMRGELDLDDLGSLIQPAAGAARPNRPSGEARPRVAKDDEPQLAALKRREELLRIKGETLQQAFSDDHWEVQENRSALADVRKEIELLLKENDASEAKQAQARQQLEAMRAEELRVHIQAQKDAIERQAIEMQHLKSRILKSQIEESNESIGDAVDARQKLADLHAAMMNSKANLQQAEIELQRKSVPAN